MARILTRRRFLTTLSKGGAASLARTPRVLAAERPLETTSVRFLRSSLICAAPQFAAEELLRAEGFKEIAYIDVTPARAYFCCMLGANREYFERHPIASRRVLRAILRAADLCAAEPVRVARNMVDRGFSERYDYERQTLSELPYNKWRDYDAEDTIRFYALRLYETGLIKSTPNKIIAENTDSRFFNELKRELKT